MKPKSPLKKVPVVSESKKEKQRVDEMLKKLYEEMQEARKKA